MSSETHSPVLKHHFDSLDQQRSSEKLGMWMFLVTEVLFFGGLFVAYTAYRMAYPAEFAGVSSKLNVLIAGINTFVLLTSSLTMTLAIRAAQLGQKSGLIRNLLITAALGCTFLGFKAFEYYTDVVEGLVPGKIYAAALASEEHTIPKDLLAEGVSAPRAQLFLSFYYVMTGIHVLHLIIGIGLVSWLLSETFRGNIPPAAYAKVECVSLYWHLVDGIWLFLMPLLYLAGNHTLSQLHF